jgi:uncharacterized protein with HEPN domain
MPDDDRIRMQHMLDAAKEAVAFAQGHVRADLDNDRLLALGLLKCIEVVGEAAARVKRKTRTAYPQIPWADLIGLRNRLVHVYFAIDLDRVWDTVTTDFPPLISGLGKILSPPAESLGNDDPEVSSPADQ